jgi:hypothetical protein
MYAFGEHALDVLGLSNEDVESIMSELVDKVGEEDDEDEVEQFSS